MIVIVKVIAVVIGNIVVIVIYVIILINLYVFSGVYSIVLPVFKPIYIFGSGGSNRIRSANIQVIFNLLYKNYSLKQSIDESRIHLEGNTLFFEPCVNLPEERYLEGLILNSFNNKNVFFGGVNAVNLKEGFSDPRRGGTFEIV